MLDPETCVPYQKNPILSAFFREIDRADELGSGMRKMMFYGKKYGGADPQLIEGDNFRMIISVPEFGENPARTSEIIPTQQVTQQVTQRVKKLLAVSVGEMSRAELMQAIGIKDRVSFLRNYMEPALRDDLLEMTQPESPNSPMQKYRLTAKGIKMFETMDKL